jgi:hypothetical protein
MGVFFFILSLFGSTDSLERLWANPLQLFLKLDMDRAQACSWGSTSPGGLSFYEDEVAGMSTDPQAQDQVCYEFRIVF